MIVIDNNYGGKEMTEIQSGEGPEVTRLKKLLARKDPDKLEAEWMAVVDVGDLELEIQGGRTDPDSVPEPPDEAVSGRGEVYRLGNHRLEPFG